MEDGRVKTIDYWKAAERQLEAAKTLGGRHGRALAKLALVYVRRAKKLDVAPKRAPLAQLG